MALRSSPATHLKQRACTHPVSSAALGGSPMHEGDDPVMHFRGSATQADLLTALLEPTPGAARSRRLDPFGRGATWVRALLLRRRVQIAKLTRYATTSGFAFGVSEMTLLVLYGNDVVNATVAAVIANLTGTVPSYLMSRYWIWKDAARTRVGRQVVLYWATSITCMALTSLATGAIASLAPAGHALHLAAVAIGFPAVSVVFWLAKFVLYERVIFPATHPTTPSRHDLVESSRPKDPSESSSSVHHPTDEIRIPRVDLRSLSERFEVEPAQQAVAWAVDSFGLRL